MTKWAESGSRASPTFLRADDGWLLGRRRFDNAGALKGLRFVLDMRLAKVGSPVSCRRDSQGACVETQGRLVGAGWPFALGRKNDLADVACPTCVRFLVQCQGNVGSGVWTLDRAADGRTPEPGAITTATPMPTGAGMATQTYKASPGSDYAWRAFPAGLWPILSDILRFGG
jgi:hypothetical protein